MKKNLLVLFFLLLIVVLTACVSPQKIDKITIDTENGSVLNFKSQHCEITDTQKIVKLQTELKDLDLKKTTYKESQLVGNTIYTIKMSQNNTIKYIYTFDGITLTYYSVTTNSGVENYDLSKSQITKLRKIINNNLQ